MIKARCLEVAEENQALVPHVVSEVILVTFVFIVILTAIMMLEIII